MTKIAILLIRFYRNAISPYWGEHCRFSPSCSAYSEDAFKQRGFWGGLGLTVRRILNCHPFHPGGYDPVESRT
ncbi:MAG: membrane protein insertion efficiency factor YidD [Candidatus Omnitrophica bacterium]|nr:membrane protein insertion efficiency factor YidD [Candidatus Omnitrophota bacterium]